MNELDQFKQTYFQECEDLLGDLESHLLTLENDGSDVEALHAVFRAIHSIKGGAGAFGFDRLVAFAHTFETTLDLMRDGKLETSPENVELSVRAADVLADLVQSAQTGEDLLENHETEIAAELATLSGAEPPGEGDDDDFDDDLDFVPVAVDAAVDAPVDAAQDTADSGGDGADEAAIDDSETIYHISFIPHSKMLERANEPLLLLGELMTLGAVTAKPDLSKLPELKDLDSEAAYLSWDIDLVSSAGREAVDEVFEFVMDDCDLKITTETQESADETQAPAAEPVEKPPAAEPAEKAPAAAPPEKAPAAAPAAKAPAKTPAKTPAKPPTVTAVRVDLEKMDRMVNMVGELVITQAMLAQQGERIPSDEFPEMHRGLEELSQHTRELQDSVMAMRAQPVKSVFSRMPRLVRELSAQTGKKVHLIMSGENTEIDKTVIEQLSDPLTHMIRNAMDHGVETPEERVKVNKPPEGTIQLSAEHRGGRIVIEVRDDGKGINRERVLNKAIEKGLVPPNSVISDEEIDNLVFLPGFSTAESISNISGRGVGMDVVVRNIQNLGGRVKLQSFPGKGSCFTMTLPLTLAVLDGMIVRSGDQSYIIPLANIIESLRPAASDIHPMAGDPGNVVLSIRNDYIPLVFLHRILCIPGAIDDPSKALVVVSETEVGSNVGIVVDEILGQQQVVIKSLEENFDPIEGIAAATILGSGKVALILDVAGLKSMAASGQTAPMLNGPPQNEIADDSPPLSG